MGVQPARFSQNLNTFYHDFNITNFFKEKAHYHHYYLNSKMLIFS